MEKKKKPSRRLLARLANGCYDLFVQDGLLPLSPSSMLLSLCARAACLFSCESRPAFLPLASHFMGEGI